jgi:hypothetical protein
MKITALERLRISHINSLMEFLYDNNADIYESLVDKEYKTAKEHIEKTINTLKDLSDSITDDT